MMSNSPTRAQEHFAKLREDPEVRVELAVLDIAESLSSQIMLARVQLGLSQSELAALCRTQQSCISQMESPWYGRMSLSRLVRVAEALGRKLVVRLEDKDV